MRHSTSLTILATTFLAASLTGCKQEAQSRNPQRMVNSKISLQKSNSMIARVAKDPLNSSMGKLQLVASDQLISQNSSANQIASAFEAGQPLGIKKDGMALTASNATNGTMFALYQCPPGYYMPYSTQASQNQVNQPNIGIDNLFSTFSEGGGLLNSLLSGLNTSDGGGILESLSGSFQSLIGLFTGGNTGTVAVPDGQTISNIANYGCIPINGSDSTATWYPPNNQTTTTNTTVLTAPTPYPYIGQVQSGPYTYYTYALPETAPSQTVSSGQQN